MTEVVGAWDEALYQAYRAELAAYRRARNRRRNDVARERVLLRRQSRTEEEEVELQKLLRADAALATKKRAIANRLVVINEPLIRKLTGQLRGDNPDGKARPVNMRGGKFGRVIGAHKLEWDDALNAGRLAFLKFLDQFDGKRGRATYLAGKIFYELQALVPKLGVVTSERNKPLAAPAYIEDDDHLARLVSDDLVEELDVEVLEEKVPRLEVAVPETPPSPPPDTRTALEAFLEDELVFGRHVRTPTEPVHARFARFAFARAELVERGALRRALIERECRIVRMRTSWSVVPVPGFVGVGLQNAP